MGEKKIKSKKRAASRGVLQTNAGVWRGLERTWGGEEET